MPSYRFANGDPDWPTSEQFLAAAGEAMHQAPSEALKLPKLAKVPGLRSYDVAYRDIAIASDLPFATTDTVLGDAAVGKLAVAGGRTVQVGMCLGLVRTPPVGPNWEFIAAARPIERRDGVSFRLCRS